jgi:hypothetical protein
MTIFSRCRRAALGAALATALPVTSAHAELGGTITLAQGDASVTLLNGAAVKRTSVDAGGTTVNEYASSTGQIFAYTWQGPTMPDLPALLGPYETSYRAGASASLNGERDLHASRVARPDVVVESGGQMRSYVGRAWLPAALPAGVTPDDLH